jgi:predicted HTH transcriptional regulator
MNTADKHIISASGGANVAHPFDFADYSILEMRLAIPSKADDSANKPSNGRDDTVSDTVNDTVNILLDGTNQRLLREIKQNSVITLKALAIIIGKTRLTVIRRIKRLQQAGLVRRVGPDKGGHWEVVKK